jgi:uncharacterized membrane protein YedE/YeeE
LSNTNTLSRASEGITRQQVIALLVAVGTLALAVFMARTEAVLASLWLLAMIAGFTLQRSRFCFASAFRDLFLFGSTRMLRGILVGLGVASTGFALIMYDKVPFPAYGVLPSQANILPVGISTVVGGLLFGYGMVVSGGCVSGSLYRMAEGYVASWVSIGGVLIGMGLLSQTWNWWWSNVIINQSKVWLPGTFDLGYGGAIALTFGLLIAIFLLLVWWESRSGLPVIHGSTPNEAPEESFGERILAVWRPIFTRGWSPVVGGAILGGLGILMYTAHMPWGVTGELLRWSNATMSTFGFAPPTPLGLSDLGGCAGRAEAGGVFTHTFAVTVGLLPGALVGALLSREFKWRFPRQSRRYAQALVGGVFMGYGAGLAIGCTIGAFFSSIASLSLSGWIFGLALAGGAFLGVQTIKRIS